MNFSLIPKAFDALRKGEAVEDAVKHKDRSKLGVAIGLFLVLVAQIAGALGYGQYVDFLTPEMASNIGLFIAGAAASWGRWATNPDIGILPARPADVAGAPGREATPAASSVEARVQAEPARSDDPARDMPLGG